MRNFAGLYLRRALGNRADKVYIMTNEDESACVVLEGTDQRVDTRHIEVGGGFVK